ncbi:MAG: hypothetical protein LAP21_20990 [Acidobacteriia bacterium]|nr:hypothetical protein [Terriglobia bacterium]
MSLVDILEPVLSGGIRNTNFFNGRLLAAEDLTDFQTANALQHRQLARALGEGVAGGLEVSIAGNPSAGQTVLHITQGLAFNRNGQAVALPADVDLALAPAAAAPAADAGLFAECQPPRAAILINPGLYVLTIMPHSGLSTESVPKTDIFTEGVAASCGSRWLVEGARFRTEPLDFGINPAPASLAGQAAQLGEALKPLLGKLPTATGPAADSLKAQMAPLMSRLRNCAAHLCFGTEKLAGLPADPFGRSQGASLFAEYGAIDQLRDKAKLADCEVPLAILYWTPIGVQFVDMWSVRRPVFPEPVSSAWAPFAGNRRMVEGLAMFLQFQCQVSGLMKNLSSSVLSSVKATDYFRYLPAAGLLPLGNVTQAAGFSYLQLFNDRTYRNPVFIEGAKLQYLFLRSATYPAIDLKKQEMLWLYRVRENQQPVDVNARDSRQVFMVFANGQMPFQGEARYDLNYWEYANYV